MVWPPSGAADLVEGAVFEDELEAEDVVDGDAVLEGVRAAGVGDGVAGDGGGFLRAGVGGEVVGGFFNGTREGEVDDAGLDVGEAVAEVDLEDLVHAGEGELDAGGDGDDAAGESGAGAAGEDGEVVFGGGS